MCSSAGADRRGDILGPIGLQRPVADRADADFLRQLALELSEQLDVLEVAVLGLDRPDVAAELVQIELERRAVARVLHHPLHVGIAPARVNPDLDVVEPLHLAVVALDHELHFFVLRAEGVGHEVQRRLLDLDAPAAGVAQRQELLVHGDGHVPDDLAVVLVLGVWMSRNRPMTCEQQVPKRTGFRDLLCAMRQILA